MKCWRRRHGSPSYPTFTSWRPPSRNRESGRSCSSSTAATAASAARRSTNSTRTSNRTASPTTYKVITVQTHRPVSEAASKRLGIRHETPQALLLKDGKVVWNASHFRITASELDRVTRRHTNDARPPADRSVYSLATATPRRARRSNLHGARGPGSSPPCRKTPIRPTVLARGYTGHRYWRARRRER